MTAGTAGQWTVVGLIVLFVAYIVAVERYVGRWAESWREQGEAEAEERDELNTLSRTPDDLDQFENWI